MVEEVDFACPEGYELGKSPITGLGDLVEIGLKPLVRLIDKVAGTSLGNCGGCRNRRKALNRLGRKTPDS